MESNINIKYLVDIKNRLRKQIGKIIIGQEKVVNQILKLILAGGHGLLVGAPGLAKTLLVQTIAQSLSLSFQRIQFTPDLMPGDITGTDVIEENYTTGRREIRFIKGPLFTQVVLADEINRTPPKTQSALLESMQEHQITIGDKCYKLPEPFYVIATQNPIEQEGTYPLPEAQLDRFMFMIVLDYPNEHEELDIFMRESGNVIHKVEPVIGKQELIKTQQFIKTIPVSTHVAKYAVALCRSSRPTDEKAISVVKEKVAWGAGPRAGTHLLLAAKAFAGISGKSHVSIEDIKHVAKPVLRHRILLNFIGEAEGLKSDDVIDELIKNVTENSI